jgi:hypothetical protein
MKYVIRGCAWATLLVVWALPSFAQAPVVEGTPIPRDPTPNFASMNVLLGTWSCVVDSARRPRPFKTTATTWIAAGGYWMVTKTVTGKVPWNPIAITALDYVTYDPTTTRWVDIDMDDYGAYDVSASPGWIGNSIVWTELASPKLHGIASHHTRMLTKVSDAKTVLNESFEEASGRRVSVTTTCTKN